MVTSIIALDNAVQHLGYSPDELTETQKINLIEESQRRLSAVRVIPDSNLTQSQLAVLELSRAVTGHKILAADIPPASERVRTVGMYSRVTKEIYISPEQLTRGRTAVNTAIHEMAHHNTGAEDGETGHNEEIIKIADMVVEKANHREYDRYITDDFKW